MLLSCLAGNLEKLFIEIYGDISKWLGTIFYNKNYNFLNATNKSKLIMVLEKLQIIISFTTLWNSLQILRLFCLTMTLSSYTFLSAQFLIDTVSLRIGFCPWKGLTKSTVHTEAEPLSVLLDSLFVCFLCESEMHNSTRVRVSDRYQILHYKYI